ncbi:TonB-dependent receptor [Sphingomonas sp. G124]|uniref:TonB-dependent receptor n=1 Tax=Sphingomonas cremea TaxID=2904799 RepID=A0A9X1QPQ5_9SPHN|nr:TonB-dependent receptor [Sphingomonas cremea]MCF2515927.1 TonB-dependent receptor [Sphingomonas cremea]
MSLAAPGHAATQSIDVPKGTVGQAAFAIGRQAGVSIAIRDSSLLKRPSPAIRGTMGAEQALMRLAEASRLKLQKVGPRSYLLLPRPPQIANDQRPPTPRAVPSPVPQPVEETQDIVVTASKRDTLSQRFPGQWTRIDGHEFAPLGVAGTEAIEARSVGFSSTHLGAGRNKLFIRGIADSSFSGPTQSPVGQYFGDMRTGYSGPDPDLKLVDMNSVELLEGPQGTLYGSGALGGIVLLKPNMPIFGEISGAAASGASVTWHGDPSYDLSTTINAPIADNIALRAVGYHARDGGYVDNRATGERDINNVRVNGGRATLSAELTPGWFIDLAGIGQRIRGADSQYADRDLPGLSRYSFVDQPFDSDFTLASFVVRKDSGSLRFRSTSGASWQDVDENFDASTDGNIRQLRQHSRARAVSNETRLWRPMSNGYSWLAGFSSIVHRYKVSREIAQDDTIFDLSGAENRVRETTLFGEVGFELTPKIEATVGARYTLSDLSGSGEHLSPLAASRLGDEDTERKEQKLLPSAALLVRPVTGLTVYARYQQGFRPGGLSIANDSVRLYRNDRLATAEAGFRYGRPGRDRFDLQGSVTHSRWYDIQADFLDPSGLPVTENIGDGRVWTLTANGGVRVTTELRLEAGVAWNDGKVTRAAGGLLEMMAPAGGTMRIPNIARVVTRAAVDWNHALGNGRALEANAYARYVGHSRLGVGPQLGEEQGDYLDSGLVMRLSDESRALSLTVTNLTDAEGNRFAFGAPMETSADQLTPLRPRTIRLGFELSF